MNFQTVSGNISVTIANNGIPVINGIQLHEDYTMSIQIYKRNKSIIDEYYYKVIISDSANLFIDYFDLINIRIFILWFGCNVEYERKKDHVLLQKFPVFKLKAVFPEQLRRNKQLPEEEIRNKIEGEYWSLDEVLSSNRFTTTMIKMDNSHSEILYCNRSKKVGINFLQEKWGFLLLEEIKFIRQKDFWFALLLPTLLLSLLLILLMFGGLNYSIRYFSLFLFYLAENIIGIFSILSAFNEEWRVRIISPQNISKCYLQYMGQLLVYFLGNLMLLMIFSFVMDISLYFYTSVLCLLVACSFLVLHALRYIVMKKIQYTKLSQENEY